MKSKNTGESVDFVGLCTETRNEVCQILHVLLDEVSDGELASFVAYSIAFPDHFFALIDTYDVLRSGIVNFIAVTLALNTLGYRSLGVRIDSGDLAYLSRKIRSIYDKIASIKDLSWFSQLSIIVSNDISEHTIYSLNEQGHKITSFGIGTQLVTCQRQPALGCVYKVSSSFTL
jgi:nicotinate phosphoribosyltransferase